MSEWQSCGVVVEGDSIDVGGVNPWTCRWTPRGHAVELPHPAHLNQRHNLWVYEIESAGSKIVFAAGELSPNVWGFYVPVERNDAD